MRHHTETMFLIWCCSSGTKHNPFEMLGCGCGRLQSRNSAQNNTKLNKNRWQTVEVHNETLANCHSLGSFVLHRISRSWRCSAQARNVPNP